MVYTAEVSRANPTCFLFLVDQSKSMLEEFPDTGGSKASQVADAMNKLLDALVDRCSKGHDILDRYHIGVIGYGKNVGPALGGALAGKLVVPVSQIANHFLRIEERTKLVSDGAGGLVETKKKFPIWFEPKAGGKTPMCEALSQAHVAVQDFVTKFPKCFPPIVIHMTDGSATDGTPAQVQQVAEAVRSVASKDGHVLLFNLHLSAQSATPIEFPDESMPLPNDNARLLFRISSQLPEQMRRYAQSISVAVSETSRGFGFNANFVSVVRFLDIGTRTEIGLRAID